MLLNTVWFDIYEEKKDRKKEKYPKKLRNILLCTAYKKSNPKVLKDLQKLWNILQYTSKEPQGVYGERPPNIL